MEGNQNSSSEKDFSGFLLLFGCDFLDACVYQKYSSSPSSGSCGKDLDLNDILDSVSRK